MNCCGQARAALRASQEAARLQSAEQVSVRFMHAATIVRTGSVTGRRYVFRGNAAAQSVDARDATALLDGGVFERA